MAKNADELKVCEHCVGEHFAHWIHENGRRGKCDFDKSHPRGLVAGAGELVIEVDDFFRKHYVLGEDETYFSGDSDKIHRRQRGESYEDILAEVLECDENVLLALSENLPDVSHREIARGAEPFYDSSANYEAIAEIERRNRADQEEYWYEQRFSYQWTEFCEKVQYSRRFFRLKELLDELFGDPKEYEGGEINPIYPLPIGTKIYRARVLSDSLTHAKLGLNPGAQLGAPPKERAPAGRMNVEFIPAFYGAFSEETAVAEMRPGIDEQVAIGEFELKRDLKVFDFTAFTLKVGSRWEEVIGHTRYDFIDQMEQEISRPVMPHEKQRQYIPTQIVAEYLKEYFGCDAVIYRSSVMRNDKIDNRNIVLLPKGEEFVGADAVLKYSRYSIKRVLDVTYHFASDPF
ncbi:RES family NAD+ phosphorylase [Mesorhizobium sp. M1428]|uniref:RES family NAD+ phosphorylase n=1 Tax=Mesorhizobium sp. M1428 TaxID=2957102 RepID=UPI00333AC9A8